MTDEQQDWQNLILHPGFLRLSAWARGLWNDQIINHVGQAANERDDAMALSKLRQVIAAQKAVEALLSHPAERLKQLEGQREAASAPATQSRRGML